MNRLIIAALSCLVVAVALRAEDWTEFRGPTGEGVAKSALPTEWSPQSNVVWKKPIPGSGWSSPAVVKDRIYLTTAVPEKGSKDLSLRALCLDAKTGNVVWNNEIFKQGEKAPRIHGKNSHASPSPIVEGDRVYVHFGHQGTAALDLKGKILWKNDKLGYSPVHGNGGSPAIVGKALVYSADGGNTQFVIALDKTTGELLWKTPREATSSKKFAFSTPLVIDVAGKKQIVSPGPGIVAAYDPADGKEIWRVNYGEGYSVIPRPVFGHGMVYLSSGYDSPVLYAIKVDGTGDVTTSHVAWTLKKGAPHTPSPLLVGDELYVVSDGGLASCLDATTGKIHWQDRIGGQHSASPMFAGGKVYFQDEAGVGTVIKAGKTFELISRNDLAEKTLASHAAKDGALYIRTEKNLYRIGK